MYRILETSCRDSNDVMKQNHDIFLPSEGYSRKIMQLKVKNDSYDIGDLINKIEKLEKEKLDMETMLRETIPPKESSILDISNERLSLPRHVFNCSNIHIINLQTKIGHGVSKQTFKGTFRGMPVAVKMVTRFQKEVKACIDALNSSEPERTTERSKCFVHPTMKLMKEILLSEQLNHPGLVKLLGYCVRSEESDTSDLSERGVVSVYELGQKLMLGNLQLATWQEKIRYSINLAEFLHFLEYSPLGSLVVRDFKEDHFLMVGNRIKMIDLDDVDNIEPPCDEYTSYYHHGKQPKSPCDFGLPCNQGLCIGFNAKHNLKYMNIVFFKRLLYPNMFPKSIRDEIGALNADIDSNIITATDIRRRLNELLVKGLNTYVFNGDV